MFAGAVWIAVVFVFTTAMIVGCAWAGSRPSVHGAKG
jgi:hypothetical protein